jgi:hypothetical protein
MAMLVEGGIYTDSDTAPVIHADQWGMPHDNASDPLLSHLSRILSLSNPRYISPHHQGNKQQLSEDEVAAFDRKAKRWPLPLIGPDSPPIVDDGAELGPPSLVVSVESDAIEFGWWDWRDVGLSRAVQIVQWSMMVSLDLRARVPVESPNEYPLFPRRRRDLDIPYFLMP